MSFFNNYPKNALGVVNPKQIADMTDELAQTVGLKAGSNVQVGKLGMGERHLVAFMRMLARDADVIVLDEISSALTNEDAKQIFDVIKKLKAMGKIVLFVTHNLNEIFSQVDEVIVLRDGEVVTQTDTGHIIDSELIHSIVGQEVRKRYPKLPVKQGKEILRVDKLGFEKGLKDISFKLRRGEVLGITGLVGSGRTTLAKCLFGIIPGYNGDIYYNRRKVKIKSPKNAVRLGLGLIPDDRRNEGFSMCQI